MGTYSIKTAESLYLNFAVKSAELQRLLPHGVKLDERKFQGKNWGFFSLVFYRCRAFTLGGTGWPRISFPGAVLRVYIKDGGGTPASFIIRKYLPPIKSFMLNLLSGIPTRKMQFDYPRAVNPGGKFCWAIDGSGEGVITARIMQKQAIGTGLVEYFHDTDDLHDFFLRRPVEYYGVTSETVHKISIIGTSYRHPLETEIERWELGFTAVDLERHSFPREAISCCFYCPKSELDVKGPEKIPIGQLIRG